MICRSCHRRIKREFSDWFAGWVQAVANGRSAATKEQCEQAYLKKYGPGVDICKCQANAIDDRERLV